MVCNSGFSLTGYSTFFPVPCIRINQDREALNQILLLIQNLNNFYFKYLLNVMCIFFTYLYSKFDFVPTLCLSSSIKK